MNDRSDQARADLAGNLVTTMQAGAIGGALLSSPFADRKGRKPALLLVAITGFIGGIMQAFSYGHLSAFYIGRYVSSASHLSVCSSNEIKLHRRSWPRCRNNARANLCL
jgi:MFS family permease